MNNAIDQELQNNEIKKSTFVENNEGEISVESGSKGPEVSIENENIEKKASEQKDVEVKKDKKDSSDDEVERLGYENSEGVFTESDVSNANRWRSVLKEKVSK